MLAYQWITLAATGLAAGLLGGLVGIGGSVIMIPAMLLLVGQGQHLAQGAAMIVNVCVAVPAAVRHLQAGAVLGPVVKSMIPAAVVAVVCGVSVSELAVFQEAGERLLTGLFGLFLVFVLYCNCRMLVRPAYEERFEQGIPQNRTGWFGGLLAGGLAGLTGGLLGVGGGIVAVPAQQLLLRLPLRHAVANSAVTMICLSLIGAAYKNFHLLQQGVPWSGPVSLAAVLAPGAIIGAYLGAGLTHVVATRYVRMALVGILLVAAAGMVNRCLTG